VPAIDADIADMEKLLDVPSGEVGKPNRDVSGASEAIRNVLGYSLKEGAPVSSLDHRPPSKFNRGDAVVIEASAEKTRKADALGAVRLRYRRVNQGESWQFCEMEHQETRYRAAIPGSYTDSPYPLQYHFDCTGIAGEAWFYPGLQRRWQGQPYYIVRQV